jgi:hypothetical protein
VVGGLIIVLILLIFGGIGAILCLYGAAVCLLAASDENQLPDIENVEVSE